MSTTTSKYGLVKPALTDVPDITAMNPNWDTVDSQLAINNTIYTSNSADDSYAISVAGITSQADLLGIVLKFTTTIPNTTACTLNVNGYGAKAICKDVSAALETGDIIAGNVVTVVWDGTRYQLLEMNGVVTKNGAQILTNKILTAPKITSSSSINDVNGNELIKFPASVSNAVNEVTISNATTGNAPQIIATGNDSNINISIIPKGAGILNTPSGATFGARGTGTIGVNSFVSGTGNIATLDRSHAEGYNTIASNYQAHAEGQNTVASAINAHAEGFQTRASGDRSHAEGQETLASGSNSHAEGYITTASGDASHAEGLACVASGARSHAGGNYSSSGGDDSFSHGTGVSATGESQTVFGRYNMVNNTDLLQVGMGTSDSNRKNAMRVTSNGDIVSGIGVSLNALNDNIVVIKSKVTSDLSYITQLVQRVGDQNNANSSLLADIIYMINAKGILSGAFGFGNSVYSDRPTGAPYYGYVEYFKHADNYVTVKWYPDNIGTHNIYIRQFIISDGAWSTAWKQVQII